MVYSIVTLTSQVNLKLLFNTWVVHIFSIQISGSFKVACQYLLFLCTSELQNSLWDHINRRMYCKLLEYKFSLLVHVLEYNIHIVFGAIVKQTQADQVIAGVDQTSGRGPSLTSSE